MKILCSLVSAHAGCAVTYLLSGLAVVAIPLSASAASFFEGLRVVSLELSLSGADFERLREAPREYVPAVLQEGSNSWEQVALKLKGSPGSFRAITDKPSFTLNMDKLKDGQRFYGMDKLHLNNSVQDASYLHEFLAGYLFHEAGIPTPRVAWATVRLNDRVLGLYVLKEGFDKTFLKQHFPNYKGNLYDPMNFQDIDESLERDSGQGPNDGSDLAALLAACRVEGLEERWTSINQVLDVPEFITFAAMETLTWHWDGYCRHKNNYRLYNNPETGKFVFLPHGMDQMFWDATWQGYRPVPGIVAKQLFEIPHAKAALDEEVARLTDSLFRLDTLTNLINTASERLKPALDNLDPQASAHHQRKVKSLIYRVTQHEHWLKMQFKSGTNALQ